ncbi:MAG: hypothetical protein ABWY05_13225 [Noviherbaspirillum sp.]
MAAAKIILFMAIPGLAALGQCDGGTAEGVAEMAGLVRRAGLELAGALIA